MTLRMPKIDPESFRGRLYLLAIDKVVIGALIAMALFVYDRWRTTEARRYDEARQETDLGFKRTEYVKELVPIVLDDRSNVLFRAHAFAALVRNDDIASVRHRVDVEHYPIEDRFYAATDYLMWSAGLPRSAAVLEPAILPAVRQFYERLKQTTTADLDYGTNYPVEWSLLRILMQTRSASGSGFKSAAEPLL